MIKSIVFSNDHRLMFSSSEDETIAIFKGTSGELLARLITSKDNSDWLVVAPDGLFDGTPAALVFVRHRGG